MICIDFDDCLVDTISAWIEWLNKKYDKKIKPEDITEWNMEANLQKFDLTTEQIYSPLLDGDFWATVKVKPDAMNFIYECFEMGQELYICTDTHIMSLFPKYVNCISKLFPMIDWNHIIICHDKTRIACDVFIDDKAETIFNRQQMWQDQCLNLLMTTNANKNVKYMKNRITSLDQVFPIMAAMLGILE